MHPRETFFNKYPPLYTSFVDKRRQPKSSDIPALPECMSSGNPHIGVFTGIAVEVEDPESVRDLHQHGCFGVGSLTKTTPKCLRRDFNGENEETLLLFPEEAFFLQHSLKCLEIRRKDGSVMSSEEFLTEFSSINPLFISSFIGYLYLRSRNWVVKSGIKFGGDFREFQLILVICLITTYNGFLFLVAYRHGPEHYHATYLIVIQRDSDSNMNIVALHSVQRVNQTSGKDCLLLAISPSPKPDELVKYLAEDFKGFQVAEVTPKRFIIK